MFKKSERRRFGRFATKKRRFAPKQRRFDSIGNNFGTLFDHCNISL